MSISWNFQNASNSLPPCDVKLALSKDHNSQPCLLLQYALKSFVLTQPDSLLNRRNTAHC